MKNHHIVILSVVSGLIASLLTLSIVDSDYDYAPVPSSPPSRYDWTDTVKEDTGPYKCSNDEIGIGRNPNGLYDACMDKLPQIFPIPVTPESVIPAAPQSDPIDDNCYYLNDDLSCVAVHGGGM